MGHGQGASSLHHTVLLAPVIDRIFEWFSETEAETYIPAVLYQIDFGYNVDESSPFLNHHTENKLDFPLATDFHQL